MFRDLAAHSTVEAASLDQPRLALMKHPQHHQRALTAQNRSQLENHFLNTVRRRLLQMHRPAESRDQFHQILFHLDQLECMHLDQDVERVMRVMLRLQRESEQESLSPH